MNRMARISSATLGMVLLAGLAFYQGRGELAPGEEDMLSGTALAESTQMNESDCESKADPEDLGTEACVEKRSTSGSN